MENTTEKLENLGADAEDADLNLIDVMFTKLGLPKLFGREYASRLVQAEILLALKNAGILKTAQIAEMLNRVDSQIASADNFIKNSSGTEDERHKADVQKLKSAASEYIEKLRRELVDTPSDEQPAE